MNKVQLTAMADAFKKSAAISGAGADELEKRDTDERAILILRSHQITFEAFATALQAAADVSDPVVHKRGAA